MQKMCRIYILKINIGIREIMLLSRFVLESDRIMISKLIPSVLSRTNSQKKLFMKDIT